MRGLTWRAELRRLKALDHEAHQVVLQDMKGDQSWSGYWRSESEVRYG